ncbi:hypothetical protein ATANTOWER_016560, partial [Ataeniobius toweri]|nr:hypothetical protein [Ataeniobius toweri]
EASDCLLCRVLFAEPCSEKALHGPGPSVLTSAEPASWKTRRGSDSCRSVTASLKLPQPERCSEKSRSPYMFAPRFTCPDCTLQRRHPSVETRSHSSLTYQSQSF